MILSDSDRSWEISSFEPRSRLIAIFRISTVPFGRTTPTAGFPDVKMHDRARSFIRELLNEITTRDHQQLPQLEAGD
jgi:hypothetical protein